MLFVSSKLSSSETSDRANTCTYKKMFFKKYTIRGNQRKFYYIYRIFLKNRQSCVSGANAQTFLRSNKSLKTRAKRNTYIKANMFLINDTLTEIRRINWHIAQKARKTLKRSDNFEMLLVCSKQEYLRNYAPYENHAYKWKCSLKGAL